MPRISDEQLNRIKQSIPLTTLLETQGYKVHKHGTQHAINCPWHDDKTPSLIISPETNLWHCKQCDIGGSNIDWVMKTQGVSFRFACEILNKEVGLLENTGGKITKQNSTTKLTTLLAADTQVSLGQIVDFYHQTLLQSQEALDYLESRGINDAELIKTFKLGYANRTLGYQLPDKNRKAGAEVRGELQTLGILRSSGHEHFSGSLVIPVIDDKGQVTELYGRKIQGNKLRKGTAQHLYLPGPHAGAWNQAGLNSAEPVILCEALIDALTLWSMGFKNVTASYGTSGFTDDHLALLKDLAVKQVIIAYDRDDAGEKAFETLSVKLSTHQISTLRLKLPIGMDVNECALQSPDQLRQQLIDLTTIKAEPPPQPQPQQSTPDVECDVKTHEIVIRRGERNYRVRGLDKNSVLGQLKVNLMAYNDEGFHTDTIDLYQAKQRQVFITQTALETKVSEMILKKDLGKVLLKLESLQEDQINEVLKKPEQQMLSDEQQVEAMNLLKDPNLMQRILDDLTTTGVVGERVNKLVGYLCCTSRRLEKPLATVIQSSSAAGKSSLMEAILNFMPEEDCVRYSAMTGQSLYYMGETELKHKILAIAEEEGASSASYALKLLQSEGEVRIASTGKDDNGQLVTKEYRVEGPTQLLMTTTAIDIDEELMNRCLVLSVDEGREQTRLIHRAQRLRRTLQGLQHRQEKQYLTELHRNAQRLLKPYAIINPYADALTFMDDKTRTRRDHEKYLTLIDTITLLHQYQRTVRYHHYQDKRMPYIEVTLQDIEQANQLACEVLGHSLDELPPQTRKLLTIIQEMVLSACETQAVEQAHMRFKRCDVRDACQWSYTQVKVHLDRLVEMEYLLVHRGARGQSFEYELLYRGDAKDNSLQMMGLIDVKALQSADMATSSRGENDPSRVTSPSNTGPKRPHNGPITGGQNGLERSGSNESAESSPGFTKSTSREYPLPSNRTHNASVAV